MFLVPSINGSMLDIKSESSVPMPTIPANALPINPPTMFPRNDPSAYPISFNIGMPLSRNSLSFPFVTSFIPPRIPIIRRSPPTSSARAKMPAEHPLAGTRDKIRQHPDNAINSADNPRTVCKETSMFRASIAHKTAVNAIRIIVISPSATMADLDIVPQEDMIFSETASAMRSVDKDSTAGRRLSGLMLAITAIDAVTITRAAEITISPLKVELSIFRFFIDNANNENIPIINEMQRVPRTTSFGSMKLSIAMLPTMIRIATDILRIIDPAFDACFPAYSETFTKATYNAIIAETKNVPRTSSLISIDPASLAEMARMPMATAISRSMIPAFGPFCPAY